MTHTMHLVVSNLCAIRGGEVIFSDLGFVLSEGEALIITGHNGSGKSTLLRVIAGLLSPADGSVVLEGKPVDASNDFSEKPFPEHCHYLGHENAMKPALSVMENLNFWREMDDEPHLEIDEALEMVGLPALAHVPYGHLSTGQKRRISIARLLISWRPIWLLDEPTAGLDTRSEAQFAALMKVHLEDGGIILAATHIPLGLDKTKSLIMGITESADMAGEAS
jgi:heme exporter protein A